MHPMAPPCALLAACLLSASAQAGPSGFVGGGGTLAAQPLPVQVPTGMLSPLSSTMPPLLLRKDGPVYYLAMGLGVPRYGIADQPGAGAWRVVPDADCARLERVALDEVRQPGVQPVTVQQNALPLQCAAAFEDSCTSRDQRLRIAIVFQGSRRRAITGGGFFGSEGKITTSFYTGVRTLSIEHLPSGRQWHMHERLQDSAAYSAPQTAIRYLPELQRLLFLGVGSGTPGAQGGCIALPPG